MNPKASRTTRVAVFLMVGSVLAAAPAPGPLRVHPANPRYFADGGGKAILLTGSHTWGNLQDYTYAQLPSPPTLDFKAYLAFLRRHHHNFFRLWVSETCFNPDAKQSTTRFDPYWDPLRDAMGATRRIADRMNLAAMTPHDELASTKFCLANPGKEYLIYSPQGGEVTVDLSAVSGRVQGEWLPAARGTNVRIKPTRGGDRRTLAAPFAGDAVLHLWAK